MHEGEKVEKLGCSRVPHSAHERRMMQSLLPLQWTPPEVRSMDHAFEECVRAELELECMIACDGSANRSIMSTISDARCWMLARRRERIEVHD